MQVSYNLDHLVAAELLFKKRKLENMLFLPKGMGAPNSPTQSIIVKEKLRQIQLNSPGRLYSILLIGVKMIAAWKRWIQLPWNKRQESAQCRGSTGGSQEGGWLMRSDRLCLLFGSHRPQTGRQALAFLMIVFQRPDSQVLVKDRGFLVISTKSRPDV